MTVRAAATSEFRRCGTLEVLTWPVFDRFGVQAMVTTRHGGVSGGAPSGVSGGSPGGVSGGSPSGVSGGSPGGVSGGASAGGAGLASLNLSFRVGDDPANVT
jgi:hypothetical protein